MRIYISKADGLPGPKGPDMIPRILSQQEIELYHDILGLLQDSISDDRLRYEALEQALELAERGYEFS